MDDPLATKRKITRNKMSISITANKSCLKKNHADSPNLGAPTKPWQNKLRDHRLDLEKQKCTDESCQVKPSGN